MWGRRTRWRSRPRSSPWAGVDGSRGFGFEQARKRRGRLASVTKSNAQKYSMVFWDEVTDRLAAEYSDVEVSHYHIDAISARMVMAPRASTRWWPRTSSATS
ncbi:MAG: isocitrate/isopropylmalate family dehydrogenase [Amaricoccus sp.]